MTPAESLDAWLRVLEAARHAVAEVTTDAEARALTDLMRALAPLAAAARPNDTPWVDDLLTRLLPPDTDPEGTAPLDG